MSNGKILAFSGSTRKASYNQTLVRIAAQGARLVGATVTEVSLGDFPLPLFDEDLERDSGPPDSALRLKKLFLDHQGLLIASPEYNSSLTAVLKNALDWISRSAPGEAPLAAFQGKVAAIMSASPGALGGLRGLVHLRAILGNVGVLVLPSQIAVPKAFEAFEVDGRLKDSKMQMSVEGLGKGLAATLEKLLAN